MRSQALAFGSVRREVEVGLDRSMSPHDVVEVAEP